MPHSAWPRAACSAPLIACAALALAGCGDGRTATIVTPALESYTVDWTEQERGQQVASRLLHSDAGSSAHAVRLAGTMESRVHDAHDLTVVVLAGSAYVRLGGKFHSVVAGDIVEIPRGSTYYFENRGDQPSQLYELFFPPYDGHDLRMVKEGAGR
jgi:mannose-6-phosphate isomerase-like protein (cupin superfamily)